MDQPVVLGIAIALIAILLLIIVMRRSRQPSRKLPLDITQRVRELKEATVTRKFHTPEDADLQPNIEYINAAKSLVTPTFDLTVFNASGVVETRPDLSEDEVWRFAAAGDWQHTADHYRTTPEGLQMIIQFERPRR